MPANASADVVVVGAGIMGACVAYHVAVAGARTVVLDVSLPASGATGASFAWFGGRDVTDASTPLRRAVLQDWRRLEQEVPGVQVRWSGSLARGEDALRNINALGLDEQVLGEIEIRQLEPNLRVRPNVRCSSRQTPPSIPLRSRRDCFTPRTRPERRSGSG